MNVFCCLVAGIAIQHYVNLWHWFVLCLIVVLGVTSLRFFLLKTVNKHRQQLLYAISYYALFTLVGFSLCYWARDKNRPNHFSNYDYDAMQIGWGGETTSGERWNKSIVTVNAVRVDSTWFQCQGKVLAYYPIDLQQPHYGEQFIVRSNIQDIRSPRVPGSFDFQQYMAHKNVHQQLFMRSGEVKPTGEKIQNFFIVATIKLRQRLVLHIDDIVRRPTSNAMVKALVLGDRSGLDRELVQQYANIGVVHVLAVSGLHVGGIYLLITMVLQLLGFRNYRPVSTVSIILLLWGYAFITGLSPSVCRASLMFSLYGIGRLMSRKVDVLNIWAVSGFTLLIINPLQLFQVGFQLSFLAVLGIILFYEPIHKLLQPRSHVTRKIWSLTVVSTVAQLSTFPVVLYYFHQVSLIFLLSNLVIVPLITLLFYANIMVLVLSALFQFASGFVVILDTLIEWITYASRFMDRIPYAYLTDLHIGPVQLVCLFGLVAGLYMYIKGRLPAKGYGALFACLLLGIVAIHTHRIKELVRSSEIICSGNGMVVRTGKDLRTIFQPQEDMQTYLAHIGIRNAVYMESPGVHKPAGCIQVGDYSIAMVQLGFELSQAELAWVKSLEDVSWNELVEMYEVVYLSDSVGRQDKWRFKRWLKSVNAETQVVEGFYTQKL